MVKTRLLLPVLALVAVLVTANTAPAAPTSGRWDVNLAVTPAFTPPGVPALGPNVYAGELMVIETGHGWTAVFHGKTAAGMTLAVNARFSRAWLGFVTADFPVGGTVVPNVVVAMDAASLVRANVNGEGFVNGVPGRVTAQLGPGGAIERVNVR